MKLKDVLSFLLKGHIISKKFDVKENKKSTTSKTITLKCNFSEMMVSDIIDMAMSGLVIRLQQTIRKNWASYTNKQIVNVMCSKGRVKMSTMDKAKQSFGQLSKSEQAKFLATISK